MRAINRFAMFGSVMLLCSGSVDVARAGRHTLESTRQAVISNGAGDVRVLVKFEGAEAVSGKLVTSAFLTASLPGHSVVRTLEVAVHTLETNWLDGPPTWDTPWGRKGGDLGTSFPSNSFTAGKTATDIRVNVTGAVQEMSEGKVADFGFILTPATSDREGFTEADRAFLGALSGMKLEVTTANAKAGGPKGRDIVAAARGEGAVER